MTEFDPNKTYCRIEEPAEWIDISSYFEKIIELEKKVTELQKKVAKLEN